MQSPKKEAPTAQERALTDVSLASWTDYVERFRPAEIALIKKAEFTAGEKAQVKGEVAADTASAFSGLNRDTISSGEQTGADVSSGKTKLGLAGDAQAAGTARGLGQAVAVTGGEIDSEQQKVRIAATGRNLAHDATANLSRGAQRATSLALAASEARFSRNQSNIDAMFAVAGAGTRKYQLNKQAKIDATPLNEIDVTSTRKPTDLSGYFYEDAKG